MKDVREPPRAGEARLRELELALDRKTAQLREVDHRAKNSLQLISSLLQLQSRRSEDEGAKAALRGMVGRVSAVAAAHRRMFRSDDVERFEVAEFVRDLTTDLAASMGRDDLKIRLDLEPMALPAAEAAPTALVVNELVCNAIQHAAPDGRAGTITVSIHRLNGHFELTVADDGVGMPDSPRRGFGTTIVQLLCQQLRAELTVEDAQPGVRATVKLPVNAAPEAA